MREMEMQQQPEPNQHDNPQPQPLPNVVAAKKTPGIAVAGIIVGALLGVLLLFIALSAWLGNPAQKAFKPIASRVVSIGGIKICDNGDSGSGIDNTTPWYEVYYKIPDKPGLNDTIKSIAAQNGYRLNANKAFISQLKGQTGQGGVYTAPYGGEQFNPKSDYLSGQNGGKSLEVTINRQTSVSLYCGVKDYGNKQPTGSGAILDFTLTLSN